MWIASSPEIGGFRAAVSFSEYGSKSRRVRGPQTIDAKYHKSGETIPDTDIAVAHEERRCYGHQAKYKELPK